MSKQFGEWVYGISPVTEALKSGRRKVREIWMKKGYGNARLRAIRDLAGDITIHEVSTRELEDRCHGGATQGVLARVSPFPWTEISCLPADKPLLLLDGVQDPHNLGAIIRSAVAFEAGGVIVEKRRTSPLSPVVAKAACGALEYVTMCKVANLPALISNLKKMGLWVVGTREDGGTPIWEADIPDVVAIAVGAEGSGLRPIVSKGCDLWMSIPTGGRIGTLNASVACAIVLYELFRERKKA